MSLKYNCKKDYAKLYSKIVNKILFYIIVKNAK